jgi:hypothetical protein
VSQRVEQVDGREQPRVERVDDGGEDLVVVVHSDLGFSRSTSDRFTSSSPSTPMAVRAARRT